MQHLQTSFFYDLHELIGNAPLLRKYYYLFKALNLSALPDETQFYRFLKKTKNSTLKAMLKAIHKKAEQTTHYSFAAISNQMTIAHLSASLIACYRTFANPPDLRQTG